MKVPSKNLSWEAFDRLDVAGSNDSRKERSNQSRRRTMIQPMLPMRRHTLLQELLVAGNTCWVFGVSGVFVILAVFAVFAVFAGI